MCDIKTCRDCDHFVDYTRDSLYEPIEWLYHCGPTGEKIFVYKRSDDCEYFEPLYPFMPIDDPCDEIHGMLADVCDILFDDEFRAMDHSYNGVVERAKEVMEAAKAWTEIATPIQGCSTCSFFSKRNLYCRMHKRSTFEGEGCEHWKRFPCTCSVCRILMDQ